MNVVDLLASAGIVAQAGDSFRRDARELPTVRVPAEVAMRAWELLRGQVDRTGHYPVFVAPDADEVLMLDQGSVADVLAAADAVDGKAWLARNPFADGVGVDVPESGEWPDDAEVQKSTDFTAPAGGPGQNEALAILALVPTSDGAEAFAWLAYGGWNDCPMPEHHVAAARYWREAYGAEPVALLHDIVEYRVARPPATREEAMSLARQQYAYCYDIVLQGTETLENLAAGLVNAPVWFFWWD